MSKSPTRTHSGGGRTPVRTPVRYGDAQSTKRIDPGAVSMIGGKQGSHVMDKGTVARPAQPIVKGTAPQVPLGNAVAMNVGKGGAGAGRTVHRSGSQSQHGPVAGSAAPGGRDILSEFGPESGPRGRR